MPLKIDWLLKYRYQPNSPMRNLIIRHLQSDQMVLLTWVKKINEDLVINDLI